MAKQKIVMKMLLRTEKKKRKAFKAAIETKGVTSATLEGDKLLVVVDGVDPIALTTMLRRRFGHAELLSVSSGDDKKIAGGGHGGTDMGIGFGTGGHAGMGRGMGFGGDGRNVAVDGVHHQQEQLQQRAMAPPVPPFPTAPPMPAPYQTAPSMPPFPTAPPMPPYPAAPAYQQYNAATPSYPYYPFYPSYPSYPVYPVYPSYPGYPQQEQDPCYRIM